MLAMPTFSSATLDTLIEPVSQNPVAVKLPPPRIKVERLGNNSSTNNNHPRPAIQPALYATPETTLLPTSPSSFDPLPPYVINHKRQGPYLLKSSSQTDLGGGQQLAPDLEQKVEAVDQNSNGEVSNVLQDGKMEAKKKGKAAHEPKGGIVPVELLEDQLGDYDFDKGLRESKNITMPFSNVTEREGESNDFFDLQDSLSIASITEVDDSSGPRWWKPGTPLSEFYDAYEEISSNSATRSYPNIEDELRQTRLNLLLEIERRKQSEEALEILQNKWQTLSHHLSLVGLRLPAASAFLDETDEQVNINPIDEFCQEVVVTRCVADAVMRACARAEVEMELKPLIESKNFETARLLDRVHYYEAANKEMCQRNQEAVETARKLRNRNRRRKKWFWGSVGLAVTLGSATIAWSYLPASSQSHDATNRVEN